jgi:hypothetical protein
MPIVDAMLNSEKTEITLRCRTSSLWNKAGEVRTFRTTPLVLRYMGEKTERVLNVEFSSCRLCIDDHKRGCVEGADRCCKPFFISNRIDTLEFKPFGHVAARGETSRCSEN